MKQSLEKQNKKKRIKYCKFNLKIFNTILY